MKLLMLTAGLAFCCLSDVVGQSNSILPSAVLNLTNWKLTLPIGSPGSPTEILQPALANFQDAYFYVNATGDGVVFTAPCGGVSTSGSSYPRSELREMVNNGTTLASWSTTSGTHTMEITEAITHLPVTKPQVIAGQIHDAATKVVDCRLSGTVLYIENASGGVDAVLTMNYSLGTVFTVKFVSANGGIAVYYNGRYIYTHSVNESGLYFKAGCYTQSNPGHGDLPTAYGQVVIYGLSLTNATPSTPWDAATDLGNGWRNSSWFGIFYVNNYPWIYHQQHGWMYVFGTDPTSIWLWTSDLGFLWTGSGVYPWLWSDTQHTWLYYAVGSSNPRYFYNSNTQKWVQVNP